MAAQNPPLPTCDPRLIPIVANRVDPFTPRRAADSSGKLGSFYDTCCDKVMGTSKLNFVTKPAKTRRPPSCYTRTCNTEESLNLLEWYNMHQEQRLSIGLQMVEQVGVGALINYSHPVDKYTRFVCYVHYSRTDYLPDDAFQYLQRSKPPIRDTPGTHVIVLVNWGIDAVVVLQLPPDDNQTVAIDYAIQKICILLRTGQRAVGLSEEELRALQQIRHTEIFSNVPELSTLRSIIDFHREIPRIMDDTSLLKPYNYNLCPIQHLYTVTNTKQNIFIEIQLDYRNEIEPYLQQLSNNIKRLRTAKDQRHPNLEQHAKELLTSIHTKWSELDQLYMREIERLRGLVVGIRRGVIESKTIHEALNDDIRKKLDKSIADFKYDLEIIREKESFITDLFQKGFDYRNAVDYGVKNGDDEKIIETKLLSESNGDRVICSSDILCKRNKSQWNESITSILKEREKNVQLRLVCVDFSYCSFELERFLILRRTEDSNGTTASKPVESSQKLKRPKSDGTINILLLGESGVGKSTFINAFANYLTFSRMEQAERKPVVLIPVSFIMTSGDDFLEQRVTFGKKDDSSNEDHRNIGQSVTQHCKSYVFTLPDDDHKDNKLRLIDTPGIGDVRGSTQDDINMQHILLYMNNLTHLDAVCILMKPNNTRLNIFFRSCFMQLFDLLGKDARDKIIFCFTNSRATFYTPGNTAPLLRPFLKSLPVRNVPFTKQNTFCFDSKSFRYLVAKCNGFRFSENEENDYKSSWDRSSSESQRFLQYIRNQESSPLFLGEIRSMKDAQLKISVMVRPILETMRNTLRNIILSKANSRVTSIELHSGSVKEAVGICFACSRVSLLYGDFWITPDALHLFHNRCRSCACSPEEHYSIDYQLEYKACNRPGNNCCGELETTVNNLCQASAAFSYFLSETTDSSQNDVFAIGFERMIKEEDAICTSKTPCQLNSDLLKRLKDLRKEYDGMRNNLLAKRKGIILSDGYERIQAVNEYWTIKSQMTTAKEWHKFMIKYSEVEVET